jgi:hypothetical protein
VIVRGNGPDRCERVHIVLIPGFGGFDALGNVEYYSGVTHLFHRHPSKATDRIVLHYFDNLPTAAVVTRASRLRSFLESRRTATRCGASPISTPTDARPSMPNTVVTERCGELVVVAGEQYVPGHSPPQPRASSR